MFIGDGDALALSVIYLASKKLLPNRPKEIVILDFDERIVNSINDFARERKLLGIRGELYNVASPLPTKHWQKFDAFYTNPPWGKSNDGTSVTAFIERGIEAVKGNARGCIVIGDHPKHPWTYKVQLVTQRLMLEKGFRIAEMLPQFHSYHLDDAPELTSCTLLGERIEKVSARYSSEPLAENRLGNFYGAKRPLKFKFVRDLGAIGEVAQNDLQFVPFEVTR